MSEAQFPKTHNLSVTAPKDDEVLADLERRHANLEAEYAQFQADLATYPAEFTYPEDIDQMQGLQDLLAKMKGHKALIAALKKAEKKPWDGVVKVIQNFFVKRDERIDVLLGVWAPRHEKFLDDKKEADRKAADQAAEAARQRQAEAEEAARQAAERQRLSEEAAAEAARQEEAARLAAAKAEEERKAKAAEAEAAEARERELAKERAARDRAERQTNEDNLKAIRRHMKDADRLDGMANVDQASDDELAQLDALVKPGGMISSLAGPVARSLLLDEEQTAEITKVKADLDKLREAQGDRFNKRERTRREKERLAEEERERKAAAAAKADREAREAAAAEAKRVREAAEAEALAARERHAGLRDSVVEAREATREAAGAARAADKDLRDAGRTADKAEGQAAKLGRKAENMTDAQASRLRGDLGSTSSLTGHWVRYIEDEATLRTVCGPLAGDFSTEDLLGATYRWMGARRMGWSGEKVTDPALPGVVFRWETYARTV